MVKTKKNVKFLLYLLKNLRFFVQFYSKNALNAVTDGSQPQRFPISYEYYRIISVIVQSIFRCRNVFIGI